MLMGLSFRAGLVAADYGLTTGAGEGPDCSLFCVSTLFD